MKSADNLFDKHRNCAPTFRRFEIKSHVFLSFFLSVVLRSNLPMGPLPPHPSCDILLFFSDGIRIDRCGGELGMPHPFLDHVQGHPVHGRVDPEAVAQALGTTVRRVRDAGLDHDALHDLPDPNSAEVPDRHGGLPARLLRFPDPMGSIQSVEELRRDWNGPEYHLLLTRGVQALLGVDSGRGQDDTLSAISVSPDDICDGVFRDAEVAGDPSV